MTSCVGALEQGDKVRYRVALIPKGIVATYATNIRQSMVVTFGARDRHGETLSVGTCAAGVQTKC